jgi:hypothetical protein
VALNAEYFRADPVRDPFSRGYWEDTGGPALLCTTAQRGGWTYPGARSGALTLTRCDDAPPCTPEQTRERVAVTRDLREAEHRLHCAEYERPLSTRLLVACKGLAEARGRMGTASLPAAAIRARLARGLGHGSVPVLHLSELDWVAVAPPTTGWRSSPSTTELQCLSGVLVLFPCWIALDAVAATQEAARGALACVERRMGPAFAAASRERVQEPVAAPGAPVGVWEFTLGMQAWLWARVALCASHWAQHGGARLALFAKEIGVPAACARAIVNALGMGTCGG